ncbi:MAG: ABC-F family ATP-binding cassette domain-containing protein [Thermoguttaceae bacterium]|nr:ABC-F family ATP-binding cassette domain-containing protein [Thermoguttaceae bacterium]
MNLLSVNAVRKYYGPDPVLDGAGFEIHPGDKIGLVGPNGAGKSTLMKIISGREELDAGTVEFHPSIRVGYLEQRPEPSERTLWEEAHLALADLVTLQNEALAVAEQMAEEKDPAQHEKLAARYDHLQQELLRTDAFNLDYKVERVLQGLGFLEKQHQTPVSSLSGGEQNRLMLAKLLLAEPDLMLLDEPSNHLDLDATEWLEEFLMESNAAVLVISHDRFFLDRVTNRTLELFAGTIDSYAGNFTAYLRQKEERLLVQKRTYEKQQEEIAKAEEFIRRNHYGMKAGQAEDRRKKLERIERIDPPREITAPPMGMKAKDRSGDIVLRAKDLKKAFDRVLFEKVNFQIERGQRWGLIGPNGCGKTTMLRCLQGIMEPDQGSVQIGTGVKIGYFDQQLQSVEGTSMVVDSIRPSHKEMDEPARRSLLARFGITGDQVFQKVDSLSGGERCRAAMARLASEEANFLILDEPTNHLDLWAREALEKNMADFEGTVLFVSHDRYFINQVATHLLVVEPGRVRVIPGNYEVWQRMQKDAEKQGMQIGGKNARKDDLWKHGLQKQKKAGAQTPSGDGKGGKKEKEPAASKPQSSPKPAKKRKYPYRKVVDIEDEIFIRETRLEELQKDLMDPKVLRDGERVKATQKEIEEEQEALKKLYEHWEEASELNW